MTEHKNEMTEHKNEMNSLAYGDIMELNQPRYPDDSVYMGCYIFWLACDPTRFDQYP